MPRTSQKATPWSSPAPTPSGSAPTRTRPTEAPNTLGSSPRSGAKASPRRVYPSAHQPAKRYPAPVPFPDGARAEGTSLHSPAPPPPRPPSTSSTSTTLPSHTPRTPRPPSRSSRWHRGRGGFPTFSPSRNKAYNATTQTRRATGPSSRNAQTAWNGVPACEVKGDPDGSAHHRQRGTRGAGRGKRERPNTRYRPEPPEPAASAAHTPTGHCTRQGSSGALRHAPTPRLGSFRASQRGSHWRQASSTGPAVPAPRATTH